MEIKSEYRVLFRNEPVGSYYVYEDRSSEYDAWYHSAEELDGAPEAIKRSAKSKGHVPFVKALMAEENRVPGTRKTAYEKDGVGVVRIPDDVDTFYVYRRSAEKGDPDYSEKDHSAPHSEGMGPIEGMREWASWYCFNKKDDGTFEAELDEAWWWGGGHNDGGTIRAEVPEEWMDLPYEEFLGNVLTLAAAAHYGFTAEDLLEREGLKEFFGFRSGYTANLPGLRAPSGTLNA